MTRLWLGVGQRHQIEWKKIYTSSGRLTEKQHCYRHNIYRLRWSFKLFCQSLILISAHWEDVLTYISWAHAVPFDYIPPALIVLIKRFDPAASSEAHLPHLSVFAGNEESSPEANRVCNSIASVTAIFLLMLLSPWVSVHLMNGQLTLKRHQFNRWAINIC